ncbi:MAG: hypothetical protein BM485_10395 [Desulfobulbaceae bacterium DB1]|nr:MAG: hypothetical protein BM485_10395 [Desulfobulbaceae bacterium DB1]
MQIFRVDILRHQLRDAFIYWCVIPAIVIGSGYLLDRFFCFASIAPPGWLIFTAFACLVIGCGIIYQATVDVTRYGHGTPNPRRPPKKLVTQGIYGYCRHPMFFGYDLAALGVALLLWSPSLLLISYPLFLFLEVRFLRSEEHYLARRYGEKFLYYQKKVPFLLPFISIRWR